VRTVLTLKNEHDWELPAPFRHDDVRYSGSLVRHFLEAWTTEGDVIFDPFAGYGTTLRVAEAMGRVPYGVEFDARRCEYVRSQLRHQNNLILGDSRQLATYALPPFDLCITSPPYTQKDGRENPFTNYSTEGGGYEAYLRELEGIYAQVEGLMKPHARVVIEVSNLRGDEGVTTLAWDVARAVSRVLRFEGEIVVAWDHYGYGYDHSYCLQFTKPV
jgi:tRNA G10  N-methylase Trm11